MGLDIESVLVTHHHLDRMRGLCMNQQGAPCGWEGMGPEEWRAHVAAVLREQIAAWLGSEAAVSVASESISDAWLDDGHGLACEYRDRPHDVTSEASAHAALAALAAQVAPSRVPGEES